MKKKTIFFSIILFLSSNTVIAIDEIARMTTCLEYSILFPGFEVKRMNVSMAICDQGGASTCWSFSGANKLNHFAKETGIISETDEVSIGYLLIQRLLNASGLESESNFNGFLQGYYKKYNTVAGFTDLAKQFGFITRRRFANEMKEVAEERRMYWVSRHTPQPYKELEVINDILRYVEKYPLYAAELIWKNKGIMELLKKRFMVKNRDLVGVVEDFSLPFYELMAVLSSDSRSYRLVRNYAGKVENLREVIEKYGLTSKKSFFKALSSFQVKEDRNIGIKIHNLFIGKDEDKKRNFLKLLEKNPNLKKSLHIHFKNFASIEKGKTSPIMMFSDDKYSKLNIGNIKSISEGLDKGKVYNVLMRNFEIKYPNKQSSKVEKWNPSLHSNGVVIEKRGKGNGHFVAVVGYVKNRKGETYLVAQNTGGNQRKDSYTSGFILIPKKFVDSGNLKVSRVQYIAVDRKNNQIRVD